MSRWTNNIKTSKDHFRAEHWRNEAATEIDGIHNLLIQEEICSHREHVTDV